jgi:hypothetical protein
MAMILWAAWDFSLNKYISTYNKDGAQQEM